MRDAWNLRGGGRVTSFPPYRLDQASGRLYRSGAVVPLRLKTFALLEYLALRPGRLVSKDEFLDAVWPDTHVTPSVLAGCVRELRRALGDDARAPHFIETAHRRGYRFVATRLSISSAADETSWPPPARAAAPAGETELAELARQFAQAVLALLRRDRPPAKPALPRR